MTKIPNLSLMGEVLVAKKTPTIDIEMVDAPNLQCRTAEELKEWIKDELAFWSWVSSVQASTIGVEQDFSNKLTNPLNAARSLAETITGTEVADPIHLQLHDALLKYGKTGLSSKTARANFIKLLKDKHGDIAGRAAIAEHFGSAWRDTERAIPEIARRPVQIGRTAINAFEIGAASNLTIDALKDQSNTLLQAHNETLERSLASTEAALEQLNQRNIEVAEEHESLLRTHRDAWERFIGEVAPQAEEQIASIKATEAAYKEQMNLKASVQYWTTKADDHRAKAKTQLYLAAAYAVVVGGVIAFVSPGAFNFAMSIAKDETVKNSAPLLLLTGVVVLSISVLIWVSRLLVRVYFEERSRKLDATERATMAQTYVALTNEKLVTEAERVVVLTSLFRPTSDTGRSDDGPDTLYHALLAKVLDGKGVPRQ